MEALSHLDSPEAHRALREATSVGDIDVRRAAIVGLGIAHRSEDLPLILEAIHSPDLPTRLIALSAMVNFHSPLILGALEAAAIDPDEQLRSAAIGFLAARPEQSATEILVRLLESELTRDSARSALLIPSHQRVSGLLVALHSVDDEVAPIVVSVLSRIDRPEAHRALLAAMKLEHLAARKAAASALNPRKGPEVKAALQDASKNDPDPEVRQICALRLRD